MHTLSRSSAENTANSSNSSSNKSSTAAPAAKSTDSSYTAEKSAAAAAAVRYPQCKTVVFRPSDQSDAPTSSDCTKTEPAAELQLVHAYGLPRAAAPRGAHGASPIVLQGEAGGIVTSSGVTGATAATAAAAASRGMTVVYATAALAVVHEVRDMPVCACDVTCSSIVHCYISPYDSAICLV
jgi:hypothetical protein